MLQTIGFGGGCHWCTEAVFSALRGVRAVEQGWIASAVPDDAPSEAVRLAFDPAEVPLSVLIEVHLRTHASTSDHSMRGKYRSAVYWAEEGQAERARAEIARLQPGFDAPIVTRVLPLVSFDASPPRFRRYYETRPDAPFCRAYIDPKLAEMRRRWGGAGVLREGALP
jgi:peptide-methionine (S)-S-oxide reductase